MDEWRAEGDGHGKIRGKGDGRMVEGLGRRMDGWMGEEGEEG